MSYELDKTEALKSIAESLSFIVDSLRSIDACLERIENQIIKKNES